MPIQILYISCTNRWSEGGTIVTPSDLPPAPVPLDLRLCTSCRTAQISATVRPDELFGSYLWVTGTSVAARHYSDTFVDRVDSVLSGMDGARAATPRFVVEVASNDGTFLRRFLERGWRALGVEPAGNIAEVAVASGIPTVTEFFSTELADGLQRDYGCADVVVARNVIPHVVDVHSVIEGLATVDHQSDRLAESTGAFHLRVVQLSGNATLGIVSGMLHEITVRHTAFVFNERRPVSRDDYEKLMRSYRKLLQFLRAGDADRAEAHWRKHLDTSRELLLTGLESVPVRDVMG